MFDSTILASKKVQHLYSFCFAQTNSTNSPNVALTPPKVLNVHVLREAGCRSIKVPRVDMATGQPVLLNFEVGAEPASVDTFRTGGAKAPAVDLTGIYARSPTGPSSDELSAATTAWLKANKPEVLDSKVEKVFREKGWLIVWTPPYCPKFQPIELLWGAGKQRASGMYYPGRDMATTRLHLRMGFYGGSDGRGTTWEAVNIAGCWTKAEGEMNKWIAVDKDHVDGGLTGKITNLHGAGNWTTSAADCLDITDMECPRPRAR
jgi:hypothetical protein